VPHIQAHSLVGAYWGMGYCHALDRGMQMSVMRVLGQGRAAELLDDSEAMVEVDTFFRRMNWSGHPEDELAKLDEECRHLIDAYCDGVNARLQRKPPWELRLVGARPDPWTPADCLLLARMAGYLTLAQSQGEVERFFVELVQGGISDAKLEALFPGSTRRLDRALLEKVTLGERLVPEALTWMGGVARTMASNNWVVGPSKTRSGRAMMANDPHLEVNRLPNVWCELNVTLPDDNAQLMTMPGIPAPLIGRTRYLAWGATYAFMDAIDSWVEDCRDGARRSDGDWVPFQARSELIHRKSSQPKEVVFYECEHGVLDGDPHVPGHYLCTRWSGGQGGAASLMALRDIWRTRTVEEGMAALGRLEVAFSWVLADSKDRIGFQMSGRLPIRHPSASGFTPMPGWDPAYDWRGFHPPEDLPRILDPRQDFFVTANQDLNALGKVKASTAPMGDYRARRISQRLASEGPHDLDSFRSIHMDTWSMQADEMLAVFLPMLPDTPGRARLAGWDRRYEPDSTEAVLFEAFYWALVEDVLGGGGLGEEVAQHVRAETGIFIDFYQFVDRILLDAHTPWLDERDQGDVVRAAFSRAEKAVEQARSSGEGETWGKRNEIKMTNMFFNGKIPGFLGFDAGPIELRGGRATPHQGQVYNSGGRTTSFAPSIRVVVDFSEPGMYTAVAGGPSDRPFSKWYTSGLDGWLAGEYKLTWSYPMSLRSSD